MNQLEFLKKKYDAGQLAHAYIFSGADMAGLKKAADELIAYAGCKFPDSTTISSAQSDSSIKNEKDMVEIDIDQIRQAQQFLSYKSYNGGLKAVVVEHAQRMNAHSQNCFLKNLEEPKGQTLIILLCGKPEYLLPTIASRCQIIPFLSEAKPGTTNELTEDLSRVLGADLAEKFKYAKAVNLEGENFMDILGALERHFRDLLLGKIGVGIAQGNYPVGQLKNIIRLIGKIGHQAETGNLNNKLALEIVLMEL